MYFKISKKNYYTKNPLFVQQVIKLEANTNAWGKKWHNS